MTKKGSKVKDEVSEKEFLKMSEVSGTGRRVIVDYEKLIDMLDGKYMSIHKVGLLMLQCSGGQKKKVYYSEVLGALKRLKEQGRIEFERRQGQNIYYHFTKVVKE